MKNFRKVLALVLVVATLFSFTAMTSAAYEDADKISYKQAVDVLSAVGVLNGYEVAEDEFEFHPTDTISREEMAKMIAVMCNAGDDVSKLYASACTFADVAKTRWSASYVAYCAKTGIVAGRSASTFDPTGKVTGLETAKMLLVALGFDPSVQGYTGADWKVNTLRDAKAVGLLKGFAAGYDIDVAITREEAAQMMLNALLGRVVIGHLSDAARIVVTNKYFANSGMDNVDWTLIDAKGSAKLYGKVVISDTTLWQALYGGNLKISETANRDCFGRPATVWTWTDSKGKTTPIGTYPATPVWTSADTTAAAVAKEVKSYTDNDKYTFNKAWVDGKSGTWKNHGEKSIGNGTQVEIYVNADDTVDVIIINTYVGTVTHAQTPTGKVGIIEADGTTVSYVKNTYGYGVADEGKVVLYTKCKDGIHAVTEPETKVVTLHACRDTLANFDDTDENVYELGFKAGIKIQKTAGETTVRDLLGKQVKLYFDANGFVMMVKEVAAEQNVAVLVAKSGRQSTHSTDNYDNDYFAYSAKFVEFEAGAKASDALAITSAMYAKEDELTYDLLLKWTDDGYGKRTFAVAADAAPDAAGTWMLKKESGQIVKVADGAPFGKVGTEATQYILRVLNASTGLYEYKYFDGCDKIDANYVLNNLQYFTAAAPAHYNTRTLTYVYADASTVKASTTAFVLSYATSEYYKEVGGQEVEYVLFNAIVNGDPAYVAYKWSDITALTDKTLMQAVLNGIDADATTSTVVNKAVKSDYYYVIMETHDDKPVYKAGSIAATTEGKDFLVIGNLLTYFDGTADTSLPLAEGAEVIVIADYKDNNTMGYTDEIKTLDSYADLEYYLSTHGWNEQTGYAYIQKNASGAVAYLYLFVQEA